MYRITIIGNLTNEPTINAREWANKETGEIIKANVCNFSVAANEGRGVTKKTMYFRMNAWRGLADLCKKYLSTGRQVYIEGVPTINTYIDKETNFRAAIEVRVDRIEFLQDGKYVTATENEVTEEPTAIEEEEALY